MRGQALVASPSSQELRNTGSSSTWLDGFSKRRLVSLFERLEHGSVTLVDGNERVTFGRPGELACTVTVRDRAAYRAILFGGSVGVGEAYMDGHWSCDDLATLTRIFAKNIAALSEMETGLARAFQLASRAKSWLFRRNTREGSRRNIAEHYDLSNDFFALFLDDTMMYSSAVFPHDAATLEEAQATKLRRICEKLKLTPNDHLLEIGSGWGALAVFAAREYGCRVTTTTVSVEQFRLAKERVAQAGLEDRVTVLLRDYRDLEGTFDKLVSVEMIEAVGHEFLGEYFTRCSRLLAPEGTMLLQAITIADQHHARHRASVDFIKEHIFPGSSIPSVTSMVDAATAATDLRLTHLDDITPHYARTLRVWRERFLARSAEVLRLGFDERFLRMWEYYLAYCEGGFEERYLGCVHLVFDKPGSRRVDVGAG